MEIVEMRDGKKTALARPLPVLVPLIKEQLDLGNQAAKKASLPHFREAGRLLEEAQTKVVEGNWGEWLKENFALSKTTAYYYMDLHHEMSLREGTSFEGDTDFRRAGSSQRRDFSTLSEFTHPGREAGHRPAWHNPIKEALNQVNLERLHRERMDRENEQRMIRQLALQIIDLGYKVLAAKLHPDRSTGSDEAMVRLNRAKALLKKSI